MSENMRPAEVSTLVPLTSHAELIRDHIAERRKELHAYLPASVVAVAAGLADAHVLSFQHMAELRGDRDPRYRRFQLTGERALPIEDLAALALEPHPAGRQAALAILRPLVRLCGYELRPIEGEAGGAGVQAVIEAKIVADQAGADVQHELDRALLDGRVSPDEQVRLDARIDSAVEKLATLKATAAKSVSEAPAPARVVSIAGGGRS